jgi:hypothetical protein
MSVPTAIFDAPEEKFSSFKLCRGVERETSEPLLPILRNRN